VIALVPLAQLQHPPNLLLLLPGAAVFQGAPGGIWRHLAASGGIDIKGSFWQTNTRQTHQTLPFLLEVKMEYLWCCNLINL
jgi:hypothetical protein